MNFPMDAINNKTGKRYMVLTDCIDATNERDGLIVYLYYPVGDSELLYIRERTEFHEKFTFIYPNEVDNS